MIYWLQRTIFTLLLLLGIGLVSIAAFFQTETVKSWIKDQLVKEFADQNMVLEFSKLSGLMPFSFHLENVFLQTQTAKISIKKLTLSPSVKMVLGTTFAFSSIRAKDIAYKIVEQNKSTDPFSPPEFSIAIDYFCLENIFIAEQFPAVTVKGFCSIKENAEAIDASVHFLANNSSSKIEIKSRKNQEGFCSIKTFLNESFIPWQGNLYTDCSFPAEALQKLIFFPEKKPLPLQISFGGSFFSTQENSLETIFGNRLDIAGQLVLLSDRSFTTKRTKLFSTKLQMPFQLVFSPNFSFEKASVSLQQIALDSIDPKIKGEIDATAFFTQGSEGITTNTSIALTDISFLEQSIQTCALNYEGLITEKQCDGILTLEGEARGKPIEGSSDLTWDFSEGLFWKNMEITCYLGTIFSDLHIQTTGLLEGKVDFASDAFSTTIGENQLQTALQLSLEFQAEEKQKLSLQAQLYDLFFSEMLCDTVVIQAEGVGIQDLVYDINIVGNNLRYQSSIIDQFSLQTSNREKNAVFSFGINGSWIEAFSFSSEGYWYSNENVFFLHIQESHGFYGQNPFLLEEPVTVEKTRQNLEVSFINIEYPAGFCAAALQYTKKTKKVELHFRNLPLEIFSLNPYEIPIAGLGSLDLSLEQKEDNITGNVICIMEPLRFFPASNEETNFVGKLSMEYKNGNTQIELSTKVQQDELLEFSGLLPLALDLDNFSFSFDNKKKIEGNFFYDGKVEHILDLINTSAHRLQGRVYTDVTVQGNVFAPKVTGQLHIKQGVYENYYTGSYLEDISIDGIGKGYELIFANGKGYDPLGGKFHLDGRVSLRPKDNFRFKGALHLKDLLILDIPIALATAKGKIKLHGDKNKAKASGKIEVVDARFSIPDSLPPSIPSVPLTNFIKYPEEKSTVSTKQTPYPIDLDIKIGAKKTVAIEGRGLTSRWRGGFKIQGTYDDIRAKGKLRLSQGNFVFAGRSFALTKGVFSFTPKEKMPKFSVTGVTNVFGTSITAALEGTVERPKLLFSSSPSLPISSILSLLIFGENIAELNVFQTATLAATAASLSGQGPDIFRSTRSSLGIDRLAVVHTPGQRQDEGELGPENSGLHVGKYIVDGVLLTLTQGFDTSSSNVGVEIDLHKGFIFQAETIQQQEQGRFSIRWNYSY